LREGARREIGGSEKRKRGKEDEREAEIYI
jgi:hypothetical protein